MTPTVWRPLFARAYDGISPLMERKDVSHE
jgi:hypothetical protein